MLISVLIPVYNGEKFIERCILSVINQSYDNVEILVINDGSIDGTLEIVESLKREHPTKRLIVVSTVNKGLIAARKLAIETCSGGYFTFLDADDTLPPNSLLSMSIPMLQDFDIVVGNYNQYLGSQLKPKRVKHFLLGEQSYLKFYKSLVFGVNSWSLCMKLYRRSFWDLNLINFPNIDLGEDGYLLLSLLDLEPKCFFIQDFVYNYIFNESSMTRTNDISKLDRAYNGHSSIYNLLLGQRRCNNFELFIFKLQFCIQYYRFPKAFKFFRLPLYFVSLFVDTLFFRKFKSIFRRLYILIKLNWVNR